jgi:REP element-mobilizing transposase RayT
MPDHIHYIIDIPDGEYSLSDFNRDFKKWIGRKTRECVESKQLSIDPFYSTNKSLQNSLKRVPRLFHEELKQRHRFTLWRTDETPIIIESSYVFEQKVNYINLNPVRKGFVKYSEYFPFSSGNEKQNYFKTDKILIW